MEVGILIGLHLGTLWQLPQRTADAIALRQELLAQYEILQARLQELTQGAAEEVSFKVLLQPWMPDIGVCGDFMQVFSFLHS